jgi:hypothetical protein
MNVIFAEIEPNNGLESREVVDFSKVFSQVVYAICMQSTSGTFILTIADIFRAHTIDILAILSIVYETVHIAKPSSSRADTAERFVVCQDFRPIAVLWICLKRANARGYTHTEYLPPKYQAFFWIKSVKSMRCLASSNLRI